MNSSLITRSATVFTPAFHTYHSIAIVRGKGCQVIDQDGTSYLDCASGMAVLNIGHNHPGSWSGPQRKLAIFYTQVASLGERGYSPALLRRPS